MDSGHHAVIIITDRPVSPARNDPPDNSAHTEIADTLHTPAGSAEHMQAQTVPSPARTATCGPRQPSRLSRHLDYREPHRSSHSPPTHRAGIHHRGIFAQSCHAVGIAARTRKAAIAQHNGARNPATEFPANGMGELCGSGAVGEVCRSTVRIYCAAVALSRGYIRRRYFFEANRKR